MGSLESFHGLLGHGYGVLPFGSLPAFLRRDLDLIGLSFLFIFPVRAYTAFSVGPTLSLEWIVLWGHL
jgi:hypothetical protein